MIAVCSLRCWHHSHITMFRLLAPGFRRALALPSLPMRALARGFAAGGPPAPASGGDLYSVVMKELQFEREDDSVDKQLAEMREALSAEWAVESSVGSALVTLSRKGVRLDLDITRVPIEGDEEPEFAEGAEDEDAPPEEGYRMLVSIDSGKGKTMRFACTISDALVVHQVQLYDTDKLPAVYDSLNNESVRCGARAWVL